MKKIKLGDYIKTLTDYHSGGSYKTLKENTKILYEPDYAVMIRTLNFERNDFEKDLIYCDKKSYDFLEYSHVQENDILMNKIANPGSVYIMPQVNYNVTCGMNLFLLRFKNIDQRYMFYVMKYNEQYIKSKAHGTTTKTITKEEVRNLYFKVHETPKLQKKVSNLLTNIDYKIENNNKINSELEQLAKTIYNYWFLQFEFPDEKGRPYKSSGGKMEWNKTLKRKIPEGWEVKTLDDISDQVNGFAFSSDDYVEYGKYKLYTIKNVQDGAIISKVDNYINELSSGMNFECLLSPNDIIMSLTGNVGRSGLVYEKNALLNQRVLKLKEKSVSKEFLYFLLRSDFMKLQIEKIATGTSQKNLSPVELGKIKVLIPSKEILNKFNKITNNFTNLLVANYQENEELESLREFLLPLLMNGKITFKN